MKHYESRLRHCRTAKALAWLLAVTLIALAGRTTAQTLTTLYRFGEYFRAWPHAGLTLSGNTLYGTTSAESGTGGKVFAINTDGTGLRTLYDFTTNSSNYSLCVDTNRDGVSPGQLILSGNTLYGTAQSGGSGGNGTVFKLNTDGTSFATLYSFSPPRTNCSSPYTSTNQDGAGPIARLLLSGNTLYGTARSGGSGGNGTVFKLNTDGTGFTTLHSFSASETNSFGNPINSDGALPIAGLVLSGNTLYGAAREEGDSGYGTVFRLNTDGTDFTVLYSFTAPSTNSLGLYINSFVGGTPGLYTNSDGATPGELILSGNTLYGTASQGGSGGSGTIFSLNTDGSELRILYSFSVGSTNSSGVYTNDDGGFPEGLILSDSTLYGTAFQRGGGNSGTVFALKTDGTGFSTVYSFTTADYNSSLLYTNSDGAYPNAGLVLSSNTLYGTAARGGRGGYGTVFAVNTDGMGLTSVYSFGAEGGGPSVILSGNTLYGTAEPGDSGGGGTIFSLNTNSLGLRILYSFSGAGPAGGLILSDSTLYGTTYGTVFKLGANGTDFTNLHSFSGSDGAGPGGLVLSGNNLYGAAVEGGSGTVFKLDIDGTGFTTLHSFTGSDGYGPYADLISSGDTLYGTASQGVEHRLCKLGFCHAKRFQNAFLRTETGRSSTFVSHNGKAPAPTKILIKILELFHRR